jgi:hypothetical protein
VTDPFAPQGGSRPQHDDADDFIGGGSSLVAAKWPRVGFVFDGTITDWQSPRQQTDMESGEPMWFYNKKRMKDSLVPQSAKDSKLARPAREMLMDFQIPEGDPQWGLTWKTNQYVEEPVPEDDGQRRMYISGALADAIAAARKDAAKNGERLAPLEVGARLQVKRGNPKKMPSGFMAFTFEARWTRAAENPNYTAPADDFVGEGAAQSDPWATDKPAAAKAPAKAAAAAPAGAGNPFDGDEPPF